MEGRPTTAISPDELRKLVTRASDASAEMVVPSAPRATEGVAPIVIIVDRPAQVVDGNVKSRHVAAVTDLGKFRAAGGMEPIAAPPDTPVGPIAPPAAVVPPTVVISTRVEVSPPVTLFETKSGAAVTASESLTITTAADTATLVARPMITITGLPGEAATAREPSAPVAIARMRPPTELPPAMYEAPAEPRTLTPLEPIVAPVAAVAPQMQPHEYELDQAPLAYELEARTPRAGQRIHGSAGGVAIARRKVLDTYVLAALMFVLVAALWVAFA